MNPSLENVANEFLLEKLDWRDSMKDDSFNPMLDVKLDLDELLKIKSEHTDLPTARMLENNSNRYTYRRHPHQIYKLMKEMSKIMDGFAVPTGLSFFRIKKWSHSLSSPSNSIFFDTFCSSQKTTSLIF